MTTATILCISVPETKMNNFYFLINKIYFLHASQNAPPYKNEHEHLKPVALLTQCPYFPHRILLKHRSSTKLNGKIFIRQ